MYVFLLNPAAGSGRPLRIMQDLEAVLRERGVPYRIEPSKSVGHCTELARMEAANPAVTAVVAVGGDGTVSEVAAGLRGTGKAMGIIPAGTGNDWIKSVGIPPEPLKALEFLLAHEARPVDTGTVNDRFFVNVCGTGFDVTVLDYTLKFKDRFHGLTPYLLGLINAISHYRPVRLTVTWDGQTEEGLYLVCSIANGRFIGGGIPICPAAEPADGMLDLVLIQNVKRWKIPFYLPGLMLSRDLKFSVTKHVRARCVRIQGENLRINIDGEIVDESDVTFEIDPASLLLIS